MDAAPLCEAGTDSGRTSSLGGVLDLSAPAPRRWYCLAKVLDGGGVAAATEEEADVVASKLKPEDVRECNSPALSLDALPPPGPDSPETSVHGAVVFRCVPASKQGGPCDHCATTGASWRAGPGVQGLSRAVIGAVGRTSDTRSAAAPGAAPVRRPGCAQPPPWCLAHARRRPRGGRRGPARNVTRLKARQGEPNLTPLLPSPPARLQSPPSGVVGRR